MEPSRVMVLPTFSRRDSISRSDCRDSARSSSSASSRSNSFSVSPSIGNPLPHSTKQQQRQGREKTAFSFCATDFPFWARQSGFLSLSKIDFGNPCSRQKWLSKKPRVLLCLVCVCVSCLLHASRSFSHHPLLLSSLSLVLSWIGPWQCSAKLT